MIAVGKRRGDDFVTVVGDVPLMIADRIAASVQVSQ
jgi:negative regulator of sigma E activity